MKRILFGIFAHPDDESSGPCATLLKEVANQTELHLICVTAGQQGAGSEKYQDIGDIRLAEWQLAGQAMGATEMYSLGYQDGSLCNSQYHEIASKIENLILKVCEKQTEPVELCLLTFDANGLTGHLDHIAVSFITTHIFYKLKQTPSPHTTVKELAYYCFSDKQFPEANLDYFVYMPCGRPASYLNRQVSVKELIPKKFEIMRLHKTQFADVETLIAYGEAFHEVDNFHVIT